MATRLRWFSPVRLIGALVGFLAAGAADAQWRYDPAVQALLPPYCAHAPVYRLQVPGGNNPAEIERWTRALGDGFLHIHHYCTGLEATNRALFTVLTRQQRDLEFRYAIHEFDYVLARVKRDFPLLPEILTKKGEHLLRLGKAPEAMGVLLSAVEIKADYWPPYAAISDYYKQAGQFEAAQEWLQKGLAASPRAAALERRLSELSSSSRGARARQ